MGPDNPWSPNWRPDPSGDRLRAIRRARHGALLAGIVYLPLAGVILAVSPLPDDIAAAALLVGLPGVALLGAGLSGSASGSRLEALFAGVAFAIGAPVAAVTSLVIGAFLLSAFADGGFDLAGPILRAGVQSAIAVAPAVAIAALGWVVAVRRLARPAPRGGSEPIVAGIDHLVIAVADPDAAVEALARLLGLAPGGGGRHPSLGTYNRLLWLGDTYIECIGVDDRQSAEASWVGAPSVRVLDAGGGLATWALASADLGRDLAALRARGSSLGSPIDGERRRPDGAVVRWRLSAPPQLDPALPPFLIEHDTTAAEWTPDDRRVRADTPVRLATLELSVDDVDAAAERFRRDAGLEFVAADTEDGTLEAEVGGQWVRLRARTDPSVPRTTIRLVGRGRPLMSVDLLGCRWIVEPETDR